MSDQFWKEDPSILLKKDRLKEFVPKGGMSFDEKLNAATRFLLYFATILYAIYGTTESLLFLGVGLAVIYFIHDYKIDVKVALKEREITGSEWESKDRLQSVPEPSPSRSKLSTSSTSILPEGLFDKKDQEQYGLDNLDIRYSETSKKGDSSVNPLDDNSTVQPYSDSGFASVNEVKNAFTPPNQSGARQQVGGADGVQPHQQGGGAQPRQQVGGDCSKCIPANSPYNPPSCERGGSTSLDTNSNMCQMPTKNNPFMNTLVTDYANNPNRLQACNPQIVMNDTNNMFSQNLYRNINDVWNRNNGQLIFNTQNSTTIPNDRESFQNWLYKVPFVCKDGDMEACYRGAELQQGNMRHGKIF